jgi:hypothetical protein
MALFWTSSAVRGETRPWFARGVRCWWHGHHFRRLSTFRDGAFVLTHYWCPTCGASRWTETEEHVVDGL